MRQLAVDGSKVRRYRELRGLTQRELAAQSGISQGQISKLEQGKPTSTELGTINKLATALHIEPSAIIVGVLEQSPVPGISAELWAELTQDERDLLEELARQYVRRHRRPPPHQLLCSTQ